MAEQFGVRLAVSPVDLAASINKAIGQINSGNMLDKVKLGVDTSLLDSAVKRVREELASIAESASKINIGFNIGDFGKQVGDVGKNNGGVNLISESSAKKQTAALDSVVGSFLKEFDIVKRTSGYTAEQIKENFKNAFEDLFGAKASGDIDRFKSGLEDLIRLARDFARTYKDSLSASVLENYNSILKGNKVPISKSVWDDLTAIYGTPKDAQNALVKAFGVGGFDRKSGIGTDAWFETYFEQIAAKSNNATDAVIKLMEAITSAREKAKTPITQFDTGRLSAQGIKDFVERQYSLIESNNKQAESADAVVQKENEVTAAVQREARAFQEYQMVLAKFEGLSERGLSKILGTSPSDYMLDLSGSTAAIDALGRAFDRISGMSKPDMEYNLQRVVNVLDTFRTNSANLSFEQTQSALAGVVNELNSIGKSNDTAAESAKKNTKATEQQTAAVQAHTKALQENEEASKKVKTVNSAGDIYASSTYGTSAKNTTVKTKNGEFVSRTDTENIAQQRKEMDKLAATAVNLRGELDIVRNSYKDLSNSVQINPDNIAKLDREYEELAARIEKLKRSSSQYNAEEIANIKTRTALLEQEAKLYREANTAGGDLRNRDVPTMAAVKAQEFAAFVNTVSANGKVLAVVKNEIAELQKAFENIGGDKTKLNECQNQFDILKAKVKNATAEIKTADVALKEINDAVKSLDRIANKPLFVKNSGNAEVARLLGTVNELKAASQKLRENLALDGSTENVNKTRESMAALKQQIAEAVAQSDKIANNFKQISASDTNTRKAAQQIARMEEYMRANGRAMAVMNPSTGRTYGNDIRAYITQLQTMGDAGDEATRKVANGFANIQAQIKAANLEGNTFWGELKAKASKFIKWTAMTLAITKARMYFKQLFTTVYDLDTALVDLKKTFNGTEEELNDFYFEANKLAKQMGITTAEAIKLGSAWSRLGYSSNETMKKMAEMSAMFAAISPDMNAEQAQNGLVSIMKAFDIDPNNVLDGILSKVNIIGNTAATSNGEIVEMLQKSSSAMREANNTLEETIALETAAVEITRDSASVGTAYKTISARLRGLDEETLEVIEDTEILTGKFAEATKTLNNPGGISLFTDASKQTFKSTYQIIKELSTIWNDLSDKQHAKIEDIVGGKRQLQIVAASISNFKAAEKALDDMANSAGSAEAELATYQESAEYALNELKETFTSFAQNTITRDFLKDLINSGTKLIETFSDAAPVFKPLLSLIGGVTKAAAGLVDTMGLLPAVLAGLSLKNIGGIYRKHAYPCIAA